MTALDQAFVKAFSQQNAATAAKPSRSAEVVDEAPALPLGARRSEAIRTPRPLPLRQPVAKPTLHEQQLVAAPRSDTLGNVLAAFENQGEGREARGERREARELQSCTRQEDRHSCLSETASLTHKMTDRNVCPPDNAVLLGREARTKHSLPQAPKQTPSAYDAAEAVASASNDDLGIAVADYKPAQNAPAATNVASSQLAIGLEAWTAGSESWNSDDGQWAVASGQWSAASEGSGFRVQEAGDEGRGARDEGREAEDRGQWSEVSEGSGFKVQGSEGERRGEVGQRSDAGNQKSEIINQKSSPSSPVPHLPSPAPVSEFKPAWQVDRFTWPRVCRRLIGRASDELDRLADALVAANARGKQVLAIAGCHRGEGATTLLLCAARRLAERGINAVLVDADRNRPRLAKRLGVQPQHGWNETAADRGMNLDQTVIAATSSNLALAPLCDPANGGNVDGNEASLASCIETLRQHYEMVLVDTGPLDDFFSSDNAANGASTKTSGEAIDALLLVRNERISSDNDMSEIERHLDAAEIAVMGLIENFVAV